MGPGISRRRRAREPLPMGEESSANGFHSQEHSTTDRTRHHRTEYRVCFGGDLKPESHLWETIHLPPVSRVRLTIQFSGAGIRTIGLTPWDAITPTDVCISSSAMFPCSVSTITNCRDVQPGPAGGAGEIYGTRLTSNPICATILARDAPGSMSQEPMRIT